MPRKINIILTIVCSLIISVNVWGQNLGPRFELQQNEINQLLRMARNLETMAQFSRSLEIYEKLWSEHPKNINYYRGVKNSLIKMKRFERAEAVIKKMMQINPSFIVEADLGELYLLTGNKEKAFSVWNSIIEKNPHSQSAYQIVASSMTRNYLYDEALDVYRRGRKKLKNKKLFLIEMANIYRSRLDYSNAVSLYLEFLEYHPSQYAFIEHNITSLASEPESILEIEKILKEKIAENKNNINFRNVLAALYIRTSNYRAALDEYAVIDQYIATRPKREKRKVGNDLFRFAQNAFYDGAYEYAIQAYQLVLERYPNSSFAPNAKLGIANAYEELGEYAKSLEKYQEVLQQHKNTPFAKRSYFRIGEIQLEKLSDPVAAEKAFKEVLAAPPFGVQSLEAIFRIGDTYVRRDSLSEAITWYNQILRQTTAPHYLMMKAYFKMGKIYYWSGNFDKALEMFAKIQEDPVNLTSEQAGIYVNDALEYTLFINEHQQAENELKKFARADLLFEQKQYERAVDVYREITQNEQATHLADDAYLKIGQLLFLSGKYDQSIASFQTIIEKYPHSDQGDLAQKMIGDVYAAGLKDFTNALKAYELVLTNYPDSIYLEEVRGKIRKIEKGAL